MHPYPRGKNAHRLAQEKQIFNLRLSRARRIVENAFGILAQRFRLYNRHLQLNVENVDKVVKASCVLHNYLRDNRDINAANAILNPDRQDYLGANGAILNLQDLPVTGLPQKHNGSEKNSNYTLTAQLDN